MNVRIFWVRVMKCMCAQTRPRFILSSESVFGGMEFEPMLTPREKSPLPENVPRGGSNPQRCGQRAQALPTELFWPPCDGMTVVKVSLVMWWYDSYEGQFGDVMVWQLWRSVWWCDDMTVMKVSLVMWWYDSCEGQFGDVMIWQLWRSVWWCDGMTVVKVSLVMWWYDSCEGQFGDVMIWQLWRWVWWCDGIEVQ